MAACLQLCLLAWLLHRIAHVTPTGCEGLQVEWPAAGGVASPSSTCVQSAACISRRQPCASNVSLHWAQRPLGPDTSDLGLTLQRGMFSGDTRSSASQLLQWLLQAASHGSAVSASRRSEGEFQEA